MHAFFECLSFLGASFPGIRPFPCVQALKLSVSAIGFTRFELLTSSRKSGHNSSVKITATILPSCDVRNIGCIQVKALQLPLLSILCSAHSHGFSLT
jgi:hypothetical protein